MCIRDRINSALCQIVDLADLLTNLLAHLLKRTDELCTDGLALVDVYKRQGLYAWNGFGKVAPAVEG